MSTHGHLHDRPAKVEVTYAKVTSPPSVGRIVHYVSHGSPVQADGTQTFPSVCRAATITEVATDGQQLLLEAPPAREYTGDEVVVGLFVMNPTGVFMHRAAQDEDGHAGGTWHWPERV